MGAIFGKAMDENMKKQQHFMLDSQRLQMERQIQMQNLMRERMMAMEIARSRDLTLWVGSFTSLVLVGGFAKFMHSKNGLAFAPSLPLLFITSYLYDLGYGSKMSRIRGDAETLLHNHPRLFAMPLGSITMDEVERRRNADASDDEFVVVDQPK